MSEINKIGVIGGGAWGTALAATAATAGRDVLLWAREDDVVTSINKGHENVTFLPGIKLVPTVRATSDLAALADVEAIFMVAPAQFLRSVATDLKRHLADNVPIVLCAKGIEQSSGALMTEVMAEVMPKNPVAVLSGPTFAAEVAKGLPAAVTIASKYQQLAQSLSDAIGQPHFRPYLSRDIVGAEVGGAVKNVLAIACGVVAGRGMGDNARAALITRGLAEMVRFGEKLGAERETMMGLCGLGDLILTCSSFQSRNMSLGKDIGEGKKIDDLMKDRKTVAEGYATAKILAEICTRDKIDMPIVMAVNDILHGGQDADKVIGALLNRPFTSEI